MLFHVSTCGNHCAGGHAVWRRPVTQALSVRLTWGPCSCCSKLVNNPAKF